MIRDGDWRLIRWMDLSNCQRLCEKLALDASKVASAGKCYEVLSIILPGSEVPDWFTLRKHVRVVVDGTTTDPDPGCVCDFFIEIPRTFKRKNTGLVFCAAFKITQNFSGKCSFYTWTEVNGVPIYDHDDCWFVSKETDADHVWLKYIPLPAYIKSKDGDQSKPYRCRFRVFRLFGKGLLLNGCCGVHVANFVDRGEDDDNVVGKVRVRRS
ncbi:hypothetical protein ACFX15_030950 [Malus domestica]